MHFSPFLTREKPGAEHRRVIADLSLPCNLSVNSGINPQEYLGTPFLLTLPTIDTITEKVKKHGRGSLLYKIDLHRAFRHIKIDPKDHNLLGLHMEGVYFDSCLPFRFKHESAMFQCLSYAVRYIMSQNNYQVTNYIDDIIGFATNTTANESFQFLYKLLLDLGFKISQKKVVRTRDLTLADIVRNICMETAKQDIHPKSVHIQGKENIIADHLSRWFINDFHNIKVSHLFQMLSGMMFRKKQKLYIGIYDCIVLCYRCPSHSGKSFDQNTTQIGFSFCLLHFKSLSAKSSNFSSFLCVCQG